MKFVILDINDGEPWVCVDWTPCLQFPLLPSVGLRCSMASLFWYLGHVMHVPGINDIYLGSGLCITNPGSMCALQREVVK